jgi:HNH endonuclease
MTVFQENIAQPHTTVPGRGAEFGSVPLTIRFWAKVEKTTTCWNWIGSTNRGQINIDGKPEFASRVSWRMHKGPIPRGKKILHRCDNPLCIRPSHLFLGTQRINMHDMQEKGRKVILSFDELSAIQRRPEVRQSKSLLFRELRWITNGRRRQRINKSSPLPKGWRFGRV